MSTRDDHRLHDQFLPLPLGAVLPEGWLTDQLRLQADGLTGRLDEYWFEVGPDNGWLGGSGESWERGPYYLDGLLPLAHLLGDQRLIDKAGRWVEWSLASRREDGSFGPAGVEGATGVDKSDDWWHYMIMLKVLTQYAEVTGDERVADLLDGYADHLIAELPGRPLTSWARARGAELAQSILWLHRRRPSPRLLDLVELINEQTEDWTATLADFPFRRKVEQWDPRSHGVNLAMGLRAPAVGYRTTGDPVHRRAVEDGLASVEIHHGQPHGLFSADEWLSGTHPSQGLELCAVVEYMLSMETLTAVFGDGRYADLLELAAFNALPATISADWTSHQYDQQANQVICHRAERPWSNGPDANLFGLEPHFGCCTANLHQGWPKFTSQLWLDDGAGGLAATSYAPCTVRTGVGDGARLRMRVGGDYPFRETVTLDLRLDRPARFALRLRIPGWCTDPQVMINNESVPAEQLQPDVLQSGYLVLDREWADQDHLTLQLPMPTRVLPRHGSAVSVRRGPLVYVLPVGEDWRPVRQRELFSDWEVWPAGPWQYGVDADGDGSPRLIAELHDLRPQPFSTAAAPVRLRTSGQLITNWSMKHNSAAAPPLHPEPDGRSVPLELVPYGCARLRLAEFPLLR